MATWRCRASLFRAPVLRFAELTWEEARALAGEGTVAILPAAATAAEGAETIAVLGTILRDAVRESVAEITPEVPSEAPPKAVRRPRLDVSSPPL